MSRNFKVLWVITIITLCTSLIVAQENCDTLNDIDGLTSASQKFIIKSGLACGIYAQITWWDDYSNGNEHKLKYGTSQLYGNEINLKPFTRRIDITTTITGLNPNTKYYVQFYRLSPNGVEEKNVEFEFTTSQASRIIESFVDKELYLLPLENNFRMSGNNLLFSAFIKIGDDIIISNLKGKRVLVYTHEISLSKIPLSRLSKGMYFVSLMRNGSIVQTDKIIISVNSK